MCHGLYVISEVHAVENPEIHKMVIIGGEAFYMKLSGVPVSGLVAQKKMKCYLCVSLLRQEESPLQMQPSALGFSPTLLRVSC